MEKHRNIVLITSLTLVLCLVGYVENTEACSSLVSGVYRFGRECQYMCHCHTNAQCDFDTGNCNDGCISGWYGPGCQFRDVAYGEHAMHSSDIPVKQKQAKLANDNKVTTCSYTTHTNSSISEPWWKVWLPRKHVINELTILTNNNGKAYFNKFTITVDRVPEESKTISFIPKSSQVCYQQHVEQSQATEFHVICTKPLYGNQVRIRLDTIKSQLVICDVKINGGRNFAFHKLATANSLDNMNNYLPENAVDGSFQSNKWDYCFVSDWSRGVWFTVDLGAMVQVTRIVLTKYNSDRLKKYQIQTSRDHNDWTIVHIDTSDPPRLDVTVHVITRYIGIYRAIRDRMILCEMQAFGDCAYGYCGYNCSFKCHCKTMEDRFTGKCISGCEGRWTGPDDTCVTECDIYSWGEDCTKNCGKCNNSESCEVTTGICASGCAEGYKQTDLCDTECEEGTYGSGCVDNCSDNCLNGVCFKSNGTCVDGCVQGFTGYICDALCPNGYYGVKCQDTCSGNCLNNEYCHHINGTCDTGCSSGWMGDKCVQECSAGKWGMQCNNTCGHCLEAACYTTDGICELGCAAGYKYTDRCVDECENGTYGLNCSKDCNDNCKSLTVCDKVAGNCSTCQSGWKGSQCEIECANTEWGEDCQHTCGMCSVGRCNIHNGSCSNGCLPGYVKTDMCLDKSKQTSESGSDRTPGIVSGVVAAVVMIAVLVVAVYFISRRRNQNLSAKHKNDNNTVLEDFDSPKADEAAVCDHGNVVSNVPERDDFYVNFNETDKAEEISTHDEYYNTGSVVRRKSPHAVSLTDFSAYVRHGLSNSDFLKQFEEMPYGLQQKFTTEAARSPDNAGKNRYKDMYPYDHCRVILKQSKSRSTTDYINASHIKGYHKENAYIAAQGPTHQNVNEFWRMIWEKDVHLIAMVTNLVEQTKMKCIKYWAPVKESVQYGGINIFTESENIFADFDVRRFKISQDGVSGKRDIIHFGYTAWPDKGVPSSTTSLLQFWQRVRKNDCNKTHPWLVHCSAGIGRTGTFIALDVLFDQGQDTGYVDVYQCVKDLRDQRVSMVQVKEQYQYLYLIVLDALVLPSYPVSMDEYELYYKNQLEVHQESGREKLLLEYKSLDNLPSVSDIIEDEDSSRDIYSCAKDESNRDKNRFSHILARDEYRPFLCTPVKGTTNYINAMYMPSYSDSHGFIITQTPLPVTAVDHCRLIVEQEVQVIVTFDEENEPENVGDYLPATGTIELGPFVVSFVSEEDKAGYTVRKHTLLYNSKEFKLTQVMYKSWSPSNLCPDDPFQMLGFLHEVNYHQRSAENKPLLAQCMNGATRSGILVALMNIIEHARIDDEVSITNVIRYLRTRRPEIVPNYEQYKFCHDVFLGYVQSDLTYANM